MPIYSFIVLVFLTTAGPAGPGQGFKVTMPAGFTREQCEAVRKGVAEAGSSEKQFGYMTRPCIFETK